MDADRSPDLASVTLAACRDLVGQEFVRRNPDGPDVPLRLVSAERVRRDPTAEPGPDRPFSLLFRGPLDLRLTQGMHDLAHTQRPLSGIFLVPVGEADGQLCYEAVFA